MRYTPSLSRLWLGCLAPAIALAAAEHRIQSRDLAVVFDGQGGIASIVDRHGYEYGGREPMPMFETILRGAQKQWLKSNSLKAKGCRVHTSRQGGRRAIHFAFHNYLAPGVTVTATAAADPQQDGVAFSIQTRVPEGWFFTEITYPVIELPATLGDDPADDRLLLPIVDGVLLNPTAIRNRKKLASRYPGQASMQWMSWYDADRGLGLIMKDGDGRPKWVGYEYAGKGAIRLRFSMLFAQKHIPSFRSPALEIYATRGSWQDMAARYRTWAMRQEWVRNRLDNGMDRQAAWLRDVGIALEFDCRPQGCGQWWVKPEDVAAYMRSFKQGLGAPRALLIIRNFEKRGVYIMPDALPFLPALRTACEQAHQAGDRTYAMTAMLKWAISRKEFKTNHYHVLGYDGRAYFRERRGLDATAINWDGKPIIRRSAATWDPDHARLCVATDYAEQYARTFAKELADAGIDVLEWDQMNGGGAQPCYSHKHGHPVGQGRWQTEATRRFFEISRKTGRRHRGGLCLSIEDPCEFWIDVVDAPTKRPVFKCTWPGAGAGSITVPAFAFVYSSVCPTIDLDMNAPANWAVEDIPAQRRHAFKGMPQYTSGTGLVKYVHRSTLQDNAHAAARVAAASSLLYGSVPAVCVAPWMHQLGYAGTNSYVMPTWRTIDPDHRRLVKNCLAIVTGPGKQYVRGGRMAAVVNFMDDPWEAVETRSGKKVHKRIPKILACAYRRGARTAWFVANADETTHTVDLGQLVPRAPARRAWLNAAAAHTPARDARLALPALSVFMIEQ